MNHCLILTVTGSAHKHPVDGRGVRAAGLACGTIQTMSPGMVKHPVLFGKTSPGGLGSLHWVLNLYPQPGSSKVPASPSLPIYSVCGCHGGQGIYLILTVRASLILLAFGRQIGRGLLGVKCHYFITLKSNK